jgi:hypothetical protein
MDVSVNVIRQGKHVLVAACDLNLLGRTLKFGNVDFKIHQDFYGGSVVSVDEAVNLMKQGSTVNMVGPTIVRRAVKEGLIHPQAILKISGVPHAQIVRF